jgi:anti-sigma-K factor RskA
MASACPFEDLAAAHALGALDGEDRAAFERHLAEGCPTCGPELLAMERVAEGLAASVPAVRPRPETRRRLLERARQVAPVVPLRRAAAPRRSWALAASVALVLLAGAVVWGARLQQRLGVVQRERDRLVAELAATRADLQRGEAQRAALVRQLSVLGARGLQQVQLAGLPAASSAAGRMFVDPGTGDAVFSASGLPSLPSDRTYQLWFIEAGKPVSAGIFGVGPRGGGRLLVQSVPPAGSIDAWAVTVEPAGGVPQPTGAMVLKS